MKTLKIEMTLFEDVSFRELFAKLAKFGKVTSTELRYDFSQPVLYEDEEETDLEIIF